MMKKVLAALLAVCMLASLMFIPASAAGFDDVADDHWAKEAIDRWADFGVLEGSDGSFRPDANMNRAEFAAMVVRLMGLTNKSGKTFADVEADSSLSWAKDYIDIAATNGIIGGYPDGSFGGKREVTFQAGATMLTRALGLATVEETSGENYATGASAKLEKLGMLDDNVKADMTFDRAGVAGLANNMIGAYVTADNLSETQEGEDGAVITGTVKGVIVVKGGDKDVAVTIKDVEVPAVVAVGGSVELSGATVETVKVTGANAVVAADKDTTIGTVAIEGDKASVALDGTVKDVTVAGADAKLTVDGEVENVTVAKDATVAEIKGTGVSSENVKNETGENIKVNDEDVAPTPAEPENPDDNQGGSTGFVPEPVVPPANNESLAAGDVVEDKRTGTAPAASGGTIDADGIDNACETHTWGPVSVAADKKATCTKAGEGVYTCTVCGATSTVTIPQLAHEFARKSFSETTHQTQCKYCDAIEGGSATAHELTYTNNGSSHTAKCDCGYTETTPHSQIDTATEETPKWKTDASFHWCVCKVCKAQYDQKMHTFGVWTNMTPVEVSAVVPALDEAGENQVWQKSACTCGQVKYQLHTHAAPANPTAAQCEAGSAEGKVKVQCTGCDVKLEIACPNARNHAADGAEGATDSCPFHCGAEVLHTEHTWATAWEKDGTHHWHLCTNEDCTETSEKIAHVWGTGIANGTRTCTQAGCGATTMCSKVKDHPAKAGETEFTCTECGFHLDAAAPVTPLEQ